VTPRGWRGREETASARLRQRRGLRAEMKHLPLPAATYFGVLISSSI
jgi:hypothetical protein